jgi:predicted MFS family arabinose efflux permease
VLLAAIALDLFAVLFGGAVALIPVIAKDRLGVGDVAYGWLRAAPGFGAAGMALLMAARPVRRHVGRTLLTVVAVFGVGTVVLGITRNYLLAFAALVVLSAADMVSVFIRGSLVPLVTPDEKRGRVLAVESVFIGASNELGAFESGMAAQAFGTSATVIGGGVATLAVVGIWWFAFPSLRQIDRFEELEHDPTGSH